MIIFCLLTGIILFFNGCEWPRDNPLDPNAINYGTADPPEYTLPVLNLTSIHSSQWYPNEDYYSLEIYVSGENSDLADSVVFVYDDTTGYLLTREGDLWRLSLESSVFPNNSLSDLIGKPFHAVLYLDSDSLTTTGDAYLFRVIDDVPVTLEPMNSYVDSTPDFSWLSFEAKFSFTFSLKIVHLSTSGFATVVKSISGINCDSTTYALTDSLIPGNYFWTISVGDILGNIALSKEAGFIVE